MILSVHWLSTILQFEGCQQTKWTFCKSALPLVCLWDCEITFIEMQMCEKGEDGTEWVSTASSIITCMLTWAREADKLTLAHKHAPTLVHWGPGGLYVQGWEMPCQRTPHGSLEGREKLKSAKKRMWWKIHGGGGRQWLPVHGSLLESSCGFFPSSSSCLKRQSCFPDRPHKQNTDTE